MVPILRATLKFLLKPTADHCHQGAGLGFGVILTVAANGNVQAKDLLKKSIARKKVSRKKKPQSQLRLDVIQY